MIEEKIVEQSRPEEVATLPHRPKEVKTVAVLLYIFAAIGGLSVLLGDPTPIVGIVINLVLANGLMKMRSWARIWTIIRSVAGIIFTLFLFGSLQGIPGDAAALIVSLGLFDLVCFVVIIAMLTKANVKKADWN